MKYLISLIIVFFSIICFAQREHQADLTYSLGKNSFTLSGNVVKNFKLLRSEKLHLGIGARPGYFQGQNVLYLTAPDKYKKIENGIDTIKIASPSIFSINLSFNASYHFNSQWSFGCNVDAIGFAFGDKKNAEFYPGLASQNEETPRKKSIDEPVKPSRNDFLFIGNNNQGTLFSEVFVRYRYKERYSLKLGYSFMTTDYATQNKVGHDGNYRFRNTSGQLMIGFGYSFI